MLHGPSPPHDHCNGCRCCSRPGLRSLIAWGCVPGAVEHPFPNRCTLGLRLPGPDLRALPSIAASTPLEGELSRGPTLFSACRVRARRRAPLKMDSATPRGTHRVMKGLGRGAGWQGAVFHPREGGQASRVRWALQTRGRHHPEGCTGEGGGLLQRGLA